AARDARHRAPANGLPAAPPADTPVTFPSAGRRTARSCTISSPHDLEPLLFVVENLERPRRLVLPLKPAPAPGERFPQPPQVSAPDIVAVTHFPEEFGRHQVVHGLPERPARGYHDRHEPPGLLLQSVAPPHAEVPPEGFRQV